MTWSLLLLLALLAGLFVPRGGAGTVVAVLFSVLLVCLLISLFTSGRSPRV